MRDWTKALYDCLQQQACVMVTVGQIKGSAPRESGSRMLVTDHEVIGSIGGGNLEYTAIQEARALLKAEHGQHQLEDYGLGPALNQCCGGAVNLLYEHFKTVPEWLESLRANHPDKKPWVMISAFKTAGIKRYLLPLGETHSELPQAVNLWLENQQGARIQGIHAIDSDGQYWLESQPEVYPHLYLFGAGHVGKSMVNILRSLPFPVTWVDSREDMFPDAQTGIAHKYSTDPAHEVKEALPQSLFLVMTHSHQLDEDICYQVLSRNDFQWLGLIGSASKRRRFEHRLVKRGIEESRLHRMTCPIGLAGIHGKHPATIAVAVCAQLLKEFGKE